MDTGAKWTPITSIKPIDTISGVQIGPNGCLACVTWNGSVHVVNLDFPDTVFETSVSRPLFTLNWSKNSPQVWYGGAEKRISLLDMNKCVAADVFQCDSSVIGLKSANQDDTVLAGATFNSVFLADTRSTNIMKIPGFDGAQCIDTRNEKLVIAWADQSVVFDLRSACQNPLSVNMLPPGTEALQVLWLDDETFAVSDKESHVHLRSLSGQNAFSFNSNRIKRSQETSSLALTRPIYALAQDPLEPGTLTTGGGDHHLYKWNYTNRSMKSKIIFPMSCTAISYSHDGRRLAVGLSNDEWSTTSTKYSQISKSKIMILAT